MSRNSAKKVLSLVLCMVLIAAMALLAAGCGSKPAPTGKAFTFVVTDLEGNEKTFNVTTEKATVGEALLDEGLIQGEESDFGLYVTTVDGVSADWDNDQTYWAFYIDGEYAMTGVDATEVTEGATYSFVLTKG